MFDSLVLDSHILLAITSTWTLSPYEMHTEWQTKQFSTNIIRMSEEEFWLDEICIDHREMYSAYDSDGKMYPALSFFSRIPDLEIANPNTKKLFTWISYQKEQEREATATKRSTRI